MKKIIYFSAMLGLLWACNPMEDTYDKLDEKLEPYKETISYTLTETDYSTASNAALVDATNATDSARAKLIKSQLAFNEYYTGADYVGAVLSKNFPALNKNSIATVTYTTIENSPSYLSDLSTNNILSTSDYQMAWGDDVLYVEAFTPATSASVKIPEILASKFPSATSGAYKLVQYNYSSTEATTDVVDFKYFFEDFESHTCATSSPYTPISENGWAQKDTSGTSTKANYYCRLFSSNKYAQVSSYGTSEMNDVFLITKQIDLTNAFAPSLTFDINVGYWTADGLSVLISENFDGNTNNIKNATWVDLSSNFTFPQTTSYAGFASAGSADLTSYAGKKIYIAFKYDGDSRAEASPVVTTTYQIDNVKVSEMISSLSIPASEKLWAIYTLDGSTWKLAGESFTALQQEDYTSMGLSYISTANAPLYIPNYLSSKFPYALEGDVKTVAYKSSSSNQAYSKATQWVLTNGVWVSSSYTYTSSDQFIHTGQKWIFDPTVHLSPSSDDFQLLVNYVYANLSRTYGSNYGNDEFYYGASAYYKNFDLRLPNKITYSIPGYAELTTEEEKIALSWDRLQEGLSIMLTLKYTEAVPDISGIPVYYWVTFATYENSLAKNTYVGIFKCTSVTPVTFERDIDYEDQAVDNGDLTAEQVDWNR
ncbi:MAG: DUF5017 domain-containing protein [Bacteroidales bacterium]